jgi:hypothetical protein
LIAKRDLRGGNVIDLKNALAVPAAGGEQRCSGDQEKNQFSGWRFHRGRNSMIAQGRASTSYDRYADCFWAIFLGGSIWSMLSG